MTRRKYDVVYADPPWKHNLTTTTKKGNPFATVNSAVQYKTMTTAELCSLRVVDRVADDCALYLWVLNGFLPPAFEVMDAWGFRFATVAFVWNKVTIRGNPRNGNGPYTLPGAELCLLGVRGRAKEAIRFYTGIKQCHSIEVEKHSRKPAAFRAMIEILTIGTRRLEMFARVASPGWDVYGNQAPRSIAL